jgi:hypothetical protein
MAGEEDGTLNWWMVCIDFYQGEDVWTNIV